MTTSATSLLTRLRPWGKRLCTSRGRTVLLTDEQGFIRPELDTGLYVKQTRVLARYRYLADGRPVRLVNQGNVERHSRLGYYVIPQPPPKQPKPTHKPSTSDVVELCVKRFVGEGLCESLHLTNYTQKSVHLQLAVELDADFADQKEARSGKRTQKGQIHRSWRQLDPTSWELVFDYHAEHRYRHNGEAGTAHVHDRLSVRVDSASSPPAYHDGQLTFDVQLAPHASWSACLALRPLIDDKQLSLPYACASFAANTRVQPDRERAQFLEESTRCRVPGDDTLAPAVAATLEQARHDLAALRLPDLDNGPEAWTFAAGLPVYVALFGRDTLVTAWEAGLLSSALLRGTLAAIVPWTGTKIDDWRDEQPGRMLHQVQDGPLSKLNYIPFGRYYGTMSTSVFFSEALFALWSWTGDQSLVRSFIEPAVRGIRWLDDYGDLDGDGFYEFETHSAKGLKNQCWTDSGQAIVYTDGSEVSDPIAAVETQALAYSAKNHLAFLLDWFGRQDEARLLRQQAAEMRKRFNDAFWMEDEGFLPRGLDPQKRPIRSVTSIPGPCLLTGVLDDARARPTANRLLADDLFSGWGVRTLSSRHAAYNPYSYQRGSVWPVENALIALGLMRYGLHDHVEQVCRAQFEAATLFEFHRLPEVFAGTARDADHPFPALYPQANWPQAWSSAGVYSLLQALLGLFPFAPLRLLVIDPHLPSWLPDITLERLRVGEAWITLRFFRRQDGTSDYEVLDRHGHLHVIRQPSPWSLTAGPGERLKDFLLALVPAR